MHKNKRTGCRRAAPIQLAPAAQQSKSKSARQPPRSDRGQPVEAPQLARTHTLLIEDHCQAVSFRDLLGTELDPFDDETGKRVKLAGPKVELPGDLAVSLGMAVHE